MAIVNIQDTVLRAVCGANSGYLAPVTGIKFPDATTQITAAGSSQWTPSGANIYNANTGLVGVHRTAPTAQLDVLAPDAATIGCVIDTAPLATANAVEIRYNGGNAAFFIFQAALSRFSLNDRNLGNNVAGPFLTIGHNSSAGANGGAAGSVGIVRADGAVGWLWADSSASPSLLRIHTAAPTGSAGAPTVSDTAGTVVGAQTSWWRLKKRIRPFTDNDAALKAVLRTPLFSFDMFGRHYNAGFVIRDHDVAVAGKQWFSWNDDIGRGQIPALNERQLFGYLAASIKALSREIDALKGVALWGFPDPPGPDDPVAGRPAVSSS